MMRAPDAHMPVDNVHMYGGQVLTVWMHRSPSVMVQVELRVVSELDGEQRPEIFCRDESLKLQSFDGWTPGD